MQLWKIALILALCFQWQPSLFAQPDPKVVLAQIQKQWATLPNKIKTLDCTIESEMWWPKESGYSDEGRKRIPLEDQTLKIISKYQIEFNTDRFNIQHDDLRPNDTTGYYEVYGIMHAISDGRTYSSCVQTEAARRTGGRRGITEFPAGSGAVFGKEDFPIFLAFSPFATEFPWSAKRPDYLKPDFWKDASVESVTQNQLVLTIKPYKPDRQGTRIWINTTPGMDYAIERYQNYRGDRISYDISVQYQRSGDYLLPRAGEINHYAGDTTQLRRRQKYTIHIKTINQPLPDTVFNDPKKPGDAILREVPGGDPSQHKRYRIANSGKEILIVTGKATPADLAVAEDLIKSEPASDAGLDALTLLLSQGQVTSKTEIMKLLAQYHAENPNIGVVVSRLSRTPLTKDIQTFLTTVIEKNPSKEVQGDAAFTLASLLWKSNPDEAEKLFKKIITDFKEVKYGNGTLAERAAGTFFELSNLQIGNLVPEIEGEDVDGKKFKLSDYRGKVVLLDFWGHW